MSLHIATNVPGFPQATFDFNTAYAILFEEFLIMNKKEVKLTDQLQWGFWRDFLFYIIKPENDKRVYDMGFDIQGADFCNWTIKLGCGACDLLYRFGIPFGK
jgi:hypothetical protein